jgi:hypothetical protein
MRDFVFELEEIAGGTLPQVSEKHVVIRATVWCSPAPRLKVAQIQYRLTNEDSTQNSSGIEVALRGSALALIETVKLWTLG